MSSAKSTRSWESIERLLNLRGLTGAGFGFWDGRRPSPRPEAATVRAASGRGGASCPWSEGGSGSTSQGETRSRDGCARTPFQRLGVLRPAAEGERQRHRDRQDELAALHPPGVYPPSLLPLPAHAFQRIESRFYPEPHLVPRRPGLPRREACQYGPRLVLTIDSR